MVTKRHPGESFRPFALGVLLQRILHRGLLLGVRKDFVKTAYVNVLDLL